MAGRGGRAGSGAVAGGGIRGVAAHLAPGAPCPALRGRRVRLAVRGREPQPQSSLVLDGGLRHAGEGGAVPAAAAAVKRSVRGPVHVYVYEVRLRGTWTDSYSYSCACT